MDPRGKEREEREAEERKETKREGRGIKMEERKRVRVIAEGRPKREGQ